MIVDTSINAPTKKMAGIKKNVWYSSVVALLEGQAVCYDWDFTGDGATYAEARRYNHVETPTTLNAQHFAGVAVRGYSAVSGGQLIEIYVPGSVCNILCGKDTDTVVGAGLLTFDVTTGFKGEFRYAGLPGEGSAQPLQTTTGDASDPGKCMALLQGSPQSGGVEVVALQTTGGVWAPGSFMLAGTTFLGGGAITGEANTLALGDGTILGQRKKFQIDAVAITGYNIVITPTTGEDPAGTDAIVTVTHTANTGAFAVYEWTGAWTVTGISAAKVAVT